MTLLVVLSIPFIVVVTAQWAWRFHLRALQAFGPGIAVLAGAPGPATTAQVVSVLVDEDTLLALRPVPAAAARGAHQSWHEPKASIVMTVEGHGVATVARLRRWQASGAPVLVWRDPRNGTVELSQLTTGQHLRLHVLSLMADSPAMQDATGTAAGAD